MRKFGETWDEKTVQFFASVTYGQYCDRLNADRAAALDVFERTTAELKRLDTLSSKEFHRVTETLTEYIDRHHAKPASLEQFDSTQAQFRRYLADAEKQAEIRRRIEAEQANAVAVGDAG